MIDFKNPEELRELMAKVTAGPWEWHEVLSLDRPCYPLVSPTTMRYLVIPCDGKVPSQDVLSDEDAQFIALSREALPYWIERAEQAEQKIKKMVERVMDEQCPPNANSACGVHHPDCLSCWLKWAMKEGE